MKTIIRLEMFRAICNPSLVLAVLIGTVLIMTAAAVDFIRFVPYRHYLTGYTSREFLYVVWMFSVEIFVLFSALFAVYPYSGSYLADRTSGYDIFITMRVSRTRFIAAKVAANAVAGGLAVLLPVLCSFLVMYAMSPVYFIPALPPGEWVISSSAITVALVCVMAFVLGAGLSTLAIGLSPLVKNRYLVLMLPLFLFVGYDLTLSAGGLSHSSLRMFLSSQFWGWQYDSVFRVSLFFIQCLVLISVGAAGLAVGLYGERDTL